jgi:hypothetical protein
MHNRGKMSWLAGSVKVKVRKGGGKEREAAKLWPHVGRKRKWNIEISRTVIEPNLELVLNVLNIFVAISTKEKHVLTNKHASLALNDTLHDVLDMLPLAATFGLSLGVCEKHCILHKCISVILWVMLWTSGVSRNLSSRCPALIDIRA